jgi:hypothetical protein
MGKNRTRRSAAPSGFDALGDGPAVYADVISATGGLAVATAAKHVMSAG